MVRGSRSSPRWAARRRSSSSRPTVGRNACSRRCRCRPPAAGSAVDASTGSPTVRASSTRRSVAICGCTRSPVERCGGSPGTGPTRVSRLRWSHATRGFAVYVVDQAQVWRCWLDDDRPAERLDDGSADFCFDPAIAVDGSAAMWTAWNVPDMPWDAARVEHVTFDGARRAVFGRVGVGRRRCRAPAAGDARRLDHRRPRRHRLAQRLGG